MNHGLTGVKANDEEARRRAQLAAAIGLDPRQLWPAYFRRSRRSEREVHTHPNGELALPSLRRREGAGLTEIRPRTGHGCAAPENSSAGRPGRSAGHRKDAAQDVLAALGAAGKFLLTPERAESERLESLRETDLLSTGPEEPFDRVVSAAQRFFDVNAASLSLITKDTQVLKSVVGPLNEKTPRDIALCTQTVKRNSMLIINDTHTDHRFASNPLVVGEPYIRFYAGYPLHGPRGWNIGTLCIIDQKPRTFTPPEQQVLRTLAAVVQHDIDART